MCVYLTRLLVIFTLKFYIKIIIKERFTDFYYNNYELTLAKNAMIGKIIVHCLLMQNK
jgi:hypothetical protein